LEAEKINGITKNQNQKNQKPLYALFALFPSSIFAVNLASLLGLFLKFQNLKDFGQFFMASVLESQ
jgi:hypothetical protein